MFVILPLKPKVLKLITKYSLKKKIKKQLKLLVSNPKHPSLHFELLEPKQYGIYSIRIDKKFRALLFFYADKRTIEIFNLTVHYQ